MENKTCTYCKTEKPSTEFDPTKSGRRIKGVCRPCCKAISKAVCKRKMEIRNERKKSPVPTDVTSYSGRDRVLKDMGFSSYREYLSSPLWKVIRARVYKLKGNNCFLCDGRATELHHVNYHRSTLSGRKLKHIFPLCAACHKGIELDNNGNKTSLKLAQSTFRKLKKIKQSSK